MLARVLASLFLKISSYNNVGWGIYFNQPKYFVLNLEGKRNELILNSLYVWSEIRITKTLEVWV